MKKRQPGSNWARSMPVRSGLLMHLFDSFKSSSRTCVSCGVYVFAAKQSHSKQCLPRRDRGFSAVSSIFERNQNRKLVGMRVAIGVVEFLVISKGEELIMKRTISVSLATLVLLGVTFGGFAGSAIAGERQRREPATYKRHHRHHRHHHNHHGVPDAASLRKRSW